MTHETLPGRGPRGRFFAKLGTRIVALLSPAGTSTRRRATMLFVASLLGVVGIGRQMRTPCLDSVRSVLPGESRWSRQLVRLQMAGTPDRANTVVDDYRRGCGPSDGLAAARNNVRWDFLFIVFYVVALFMGAALTASYTTTSILRLFGILGAAAALGAGILDLLENAVLLKMLNGAVASPWPLLARGLATVKFGLVASILVYVAVAWVLWLLRSMRWAGGSEADGRAAVPDRSPAPASSSDPPRPGSTGDPAGISAVLAQELEYLSHHREAGERDLVGLALSGGGIRSATTCLGVLQGMAQLGLLSRVDYLSTVSGGGYLGGCFSSLLSLNGARLPANPLSDGEATHAPYEFAAGDGVAFGADWKRFPFRDDRGGEEGRRAAELTAHLRTHGNFLIARRGLISRDTLRAIGNVLNGIIYNVGGFIVALVAATTLWLTVVTRLTPHIGPTLGMQPIASVSAAGDTLPVTLPPRPAFARADTAMTRATTTRCEVSDGDCEVQSAIPLRPAAFGDLVRWQVARLVSPFTVVQSRSGDGLAVRFGIGIAVLFGVLLTALAFAALVIGLGIARGWSFAQTLRDRIVAENLLAPPLPGESEEEVFDKALLWFCTALTLLLVAAGTLAGRMGASSGPIELLALWLPLMVLAVARVTGFALSLVLPLIANGDVWSRRMRGLWGGFQATLIYALWASLILLALVPLTFAAADQGPALAVGTLVSLIATRFLTPGRSAESRRFTIPPALRKPLLALAVVLVFLLGVLFIAAMMVSSQRLDEATRWFAISATVLVALGWLVDHNKLGPHYFYRDRLAETYLKSELKDDHRRHWTYRDAMELPLARLHGDAKDGVKNWRNPAPYHLVSAAINLAGSRDLTRKDRKSGYWLFSKLYCGSEHTGFRPTGTYRGGETKLARALAISGAAASSAMGFHTFFAQAFATVLFNVRLGSWIENPRRERSLKRKEGWIFWPRYIWREVTMQTNEHTPLVNLSDGGHTGDNVGIYPLLQRRCKVIIAVDAERDKKLSFGSFTEALRHAYIDEGIQVDIDLTMIRADKETGRSRSHCAVGRIRYPDRPDQASWLVYLKSSMTGDEPEPVLSYEGTSPDFPHETTGDQFFDDAQFESYRSLGVHIARDTFARWANLQDARLAMGLA